MLHFTTIIKPLTDTKLKQQWMNVSSNIRNGFPSIPFADELNRQKLMEIEAEMEKRGLVTSIKVSK